MPAMAQGCRAGAGAACPPSTDVEHLVPRQMPNTGIPAESAPRNGANSQASRRAKVIGGRMRLLAISCRVQVVAPGDHQSVQAVQRPDALGVDRLQRQRGCNTPAMVIAASSNRRADNPQEYIRCAPAPDKPSGNHRATRAQCDAAAAKPSTVSRHHQTKAQIHVSSPNR